MKTIRSTLMFLVIFLLSACSTSTSNPGAIVAPTATPGRSTETTGAINDVTANPASDPTKFSPEQVSAVSFQNDIMPLLYGHCTSCHGTEKISRNLDLRTYEAMMKGSQNGAVVVPGNSAESSLITLIIEGKMPKRGAKLSEEEKDLFIQWIDQGALNN